MLKKLFFIFNLTKAYSLAGNHNNYKALSLLNKYTNEAEKYKSKFPDYYILKGSLNYEIEDYSQAQKDLEISTELLTDNEYYNQDEKKYLYCYIYNYLSNILHKKNDNEWVVFDDLSKRNNFDIKKVSKTTKINFPFAI